MNEFTSKLHVYKFGTPPQDIVSCIWEYSKIQKCPHSNIYLSPKLHRDLKGVIQTCLCARDEICFGLTCIIHLELILTTVTYRVVCRAWGEESAHRTWERKDAATSKAPGGLPRERSEVKSSSPCSGFPEQKGENAKEILVRGAEGAGIPESTGRTPPLLELCLLCQ